MAVEDFRAAAYAANHAAGHVGGYLESAARSTTTQEYIVNDRIITFADQISIDSDANVYYEPFILDGRVGYRCVNMDGSGRETFLYLNPSGGSDDGVPTIFVYQGGENDPAQDGALVHFSLEEITD